jgi:hypothetical protein
MGIAAMVFAVALQGAARQPAVNPCVIPGAPRTAVPLRPVDQAAMQPDFFTFRARLQAAIAGRDEAALLAAVDPGIRLSFGDDNGLDELRKQLRDPKSTLWTELATALALGGTFTSATTFTAPYVFAAWPQGLDSFECAAVLGERVRVRTTAQADSTVVGSVSYEIVQVLPAAREGEPVHVRLANGVTGFVAAPFLRSPIGRRAIFDRAGGRWVMRAFVAGD